MYFWDINKLKMNLSSDKLSELEQFKYLLANMIVGPLFLQTSQLRYEHKINWIFSLVITVGGICYCYKMNKGSTGNLFLSRFLSIAFVVNIRLCLFFLPLMFFIEFMALAFDFGGISIKTMETVFLIGFFLFEVFYYWRVGYHLSEVSLLKKSI